MALFVQAWSAAWTAKIPITITLLKEGEIFYMSGAVMSAAENDHVERRSISIESLK